MQNDRGGIYRDKEEIMTPLDCIRQRERESSSGRGERAVDFPSIARGAVQISASC
jgi:hypothetical protein